MGDRTRRLGKEGEAAANGNAIYRGDAGLRVRTGRAGRERTRCAGDTGAHGVVAPTTSAANGEDTFYPAPQRLNVVVLALSTAADKGETLSTAARCALRGPR